MGSAFDTKRRGDYIYLVIAALHHHPIKGVTSGARLNTLQQPLGFVQLTTTSIYADATGSEKRQLVERMSALNITRIHILMAA